ERRVPVVGFYELAIEALKRARDIQEILRLVIPVIVQQVSPAEQQMTLQYFMYVLEIMVTEGWVKAGLDPSRPRLGLKCPRIGELIRPHVDFSQAGTRT